MRAQHGTDRWTRQPSRIANAQLVARAENLGGILQAAGTSDGLVRAKFGEWEERLGVLASDEVRFTRLRRGDDIGTDSALTCQRTLADSIPRLANVSLMGSSTSSQSTTLRTLRRALDDLDDLRAMRSRMIDEAKHAFAQDDIRPAVIREASKRLGATAARGEPKLEMAQFEDLFQVELVKFKRFRTAMGENGNRQEDLLDRIKVCLKLSPFRLGFSSLVSSLSECWMTADDQRHVPASPSN
jgi:programmed cell death 6-interacting protein